MTRGLAKSDISDLDFVDAAELVSDGQSAFLTSVTVVSTTASTKRVVVSGIYMLNDADQRVEPGDKITLSGTTGGADGTYTVDSVVDDVTLVVEETIVDSTGGSADFTWPPGALRVGVDTTSFTHSTAATLQGMAQELDGALVSEAEHEVLRQLTHFVETNSPGEGFGSGPLYCETTYTDSVFPTRETWYETSGKTKKICQWDGTYNANKTFATEKWTVYKSDGTNPAADATDTITYSGVIETSRSRAIVVH